MPTLIKFFSVDGIVALNKPVLLCLGIIPKTVFKCTSWPYSNSLSASSSIKNSNFLKLKTCLSLTRSKSLPGVATTILAPFS